MLKQNEIRKAEHRKEDFSPLNLLAASLFISELSLTLIPMPLQLNRGNIFKPTSGMLEIFIFNILLYCKATGNNSCCILLMGKDILK